jgi:hypothetical protein
MKESLLNLNEFIYDFNLRNPNGTISFNARIYFTIDQTIQTKDSEVHIITSDNLASIYFLSSAINSAELPDMFDLRTATLVYINNHYLKIEGNRYTVSIFPVANPG